MKNQRLPMLVAAASLACAVTARAEIFAFIDMPMTGTQESPMVTTSGFGSFSGLYDNVSKVLMFNVTWQLQSDASVTAAHFHGPANQGQSAGISVPVSGLAATNAGRYGGSITLTSAQEAELLAGLWYFNIHSTAVPGGELRGQLLDNGTSTASPRFSTATGTFTLPAVLVPELGVYAAQLQLVPGSASLQFMLTAGSAVR